MTYENIKSVILAFLVALSGFLTWNIWNYQPDYELVNNQKTVEEVNIATQKELKKIVKPHQIIYHAGGKQFGSVDNGYIDNIIGVISKWKYFDMEQYPGRISEFNEKIAQGDNTEIIFPDEVPIELYKRVLNIDEKDIPKFDFDRIIINSETEQKQEGIVYFYSQKNQEVYVSNVSPSYINSFTKKYYDSSRRLTPYFLYTVSDIRKIYLPTEEVNMVMHTYYQNPLDSEKFKDALFADPSFVQRSMVDGVEEYTDDASKMIVDTQTNMINYVNPVRSGDSVIGTNNVLQKSIEFVNSHGGWTETYRYVYKDDFNQNVLFRLYSKEGYPVFNQIGMSEIYQQWRQSEISRYVRPGFHLELPLNPEVVTKTLPSGYEALEYLQSKKDFKLELLQNLMPGYYMTQGPENSLILLEPGWFYLYDLQWRQLIWEEELNNGLE
ncbi:two-component system activity regulator YycH [Mesobacillus subterraneus]|uniref:YycH family regulatory protein n=1 Tax=Mesobacillus subterraneus TaxID=285983 RepID=UPI002040309C|nr:two-component system activity regulator YycH [Mesobacillus subterraneus]MCM3574903.1 two-component system activity regulator YycH [Mesobacillus subterraneus]